MDKDKWIKLGKRLLFPHIIIVVLLVLLSVPLLVYSLGYEAANPIIAYMSYLISAYALTVVVARMPALAKRVKGSLYANRYSGRYLSEPQLRARISLYAGCGISIVYAVLKFLAGLYYGSLWLGAIAVYYVIISLIRYGLMKGDRYWQKNGDSVHRRLYGLKCYRFCGCLMFVLHVAVMALVVQVVWQNKSYSYPGFLIYASAAYTFYCLGIAVVNILKYRRMEQPILSAAKMLSFACALTSMLALQTAMMTQFGNNDGYFTRIMNSLTGGAVCLIVFALSIRMVRGANREIRRLKET